MVPALATTQRPHVPRDRQADEAAEHMWMGQPLSDLPDEELEEILATLQRVLYGKLIIAPAGLGRLRLMASIRDLDLEAARRRPGRVS